MALILQPPRIRPVSFVEQQFVWNRSMFSLYVEQLFCQDLV